MSALGSVGRTAAGHVYAPAIRAEATPLLSAAPRRCSGERQPEAPEWGAKGREARLGARIIQAPPAIGPPAGGGSCWMLPHGQACGGLQAQPVMM